MTRRWAAVVALVVVGSTELLGHGLGGHADDPRYWRGALAVAVYELARRGALG
jgi:hypothetical protein